MSRYFKKYINLLLSKAKSTEYSYEKSIVLFGSVLDFMKRVYYIEKIRDYFELDYIIQVKEKIASLLVSKASKEKKTEDIEMLVAYVFESLIESAYYNRKQKENNIPGKIIYSLNEMISLRENFNKYIVKLDFSLLNTDDSDIYQFGYSYIDSLFGYKTKEQLIGYMQSIYGEDVTLSIDNKYVSFLLNVSPVQFPKEGIADVILREIASFIRGYKLPADKIILMFYEKGANNQITYEMKTDGESVYKVKREQFINRKGLSFQCDNRNGIWKIMFDSRKEI